MVTSYIAIEKTAKEIVSFPMNKGDFPWFFVCLPEGFPDMNIMGYEGFPKPIVFSDIMLMSRMDI